MLVGMLVIVGLFVPLASAIMLWRASIAAPVYPTYVENDYGRAVLPVDEYIATFTCPNTIPAWMETEASL